MTPDTPDIALTGAQALVECLRQQQVTQCFLVPGESYLAVLDALVDAPEIDTTVCRQEGGAAMMAEACGKLTSRPGICMVTRGPGATNASAGLHIARQDATPMILFVGQAARDMREREAFQKIDYRRMFGQVAKWVAEVDSADRMAEMVSRAFHVAMSGRPGPVVLALPEDMLVEAASSAVPLMPPAQPARGGITDEDINPARSPGDGGNPDDRRWRRCVVRRGADEPSRVCDTVVSAGGGLVPVPGLL